VLARLRGRDDQPIGAERRQGRVFDDFAEHLADLLERGQGLANRKLVGPGDLKKALDAQLIFGGRLGTNLLDLGLLDEETLTEALKEQKRVDVATYGNPDGSPKPIRDRLPVSIDFYGNDISNMEDNCLEADGGAHNIRIFRNRCFNHGHRALSVQPAFGGPVYFIRNIVYHAPEGGAVKFTASSAGIVVYHNTLIAPIKPMLLAASNVHYRNNLVLGKSETLETFAVETNTNYSSSDYNGFRPNDGAEFSFEWSTPPLAMRANFPGEPGTLSTQQQTQLEAKAREVRRFKTLKEYAAATGEDTHSVLVDYDVFVNVKAPGPDPRTLYKPADFDFQLRPGSAAVDAGVRLPGVNDDFSGRAPDLGAYEVGKPLPHYGPR